MLRPQLNLIGAYYSIPTTNVVASSDTASRNGLVVTFDYYVTKEFDVSAVTPVRAYTAFSWRDTSRNSSTTGGDAGSESMLPLGHYSQRQRGTAAQRSYDGRFPALLDAAVGARRLLGQHPLLSFYPVYHRPPDGATVRGLSCTGKVNATAAQRSSSSS